MESLKWPALELCRKIAILSFFHKIMYSSSPVDLPSYFDIINRPTRQCHPFYVIILYTATSAYLGSFFPRTIKEWNALPIYLIEFDDNDLFHYELTN